MENKETQDTETEIEVESNTIKDLIIKLDTLLIKKEKYKNPSRITNNLLRDMKNYAKYRLIGGKIGKDTELHKIVSQLSIINTYSKRLLENNYFKLIILNPNVPINYVEGKKKQGKLIKYEQEK